VCVSVNISSRAQISQERNQNLARAQTQQIDAENKEMLQQILANQQNLAQVVQLHKAGESIAREVMEEGQKVIYTLSLSLSFYFPLNENTFFFSQKVLKHMRSTSSDGSFLWNSNEKRYLDVQRGLMNLHDLTGIPPLIKILDGEIKKMGELAVAGGPSSDIWRGIWLGQKRVRSPYFKSHFHTLFSFILFLFITKVALKTIRAVQSNDTKAQKVCPNFFSSKKKKRSS